MEIVFEILLSALLLIGSFFVLVGAYSLVRLPDFFRRLHGPTKASTLGVGCLLAASIGFHAFVGSDPQPRELLITVFLFITAPIGAHLMAKAALSLRVDTRPDLPTAADDDAGTDVSDVPPRPDARDIAEVRDA
ncbi:MAG TPA: Na+/H+ antiporter subunit G [Luteimonas sp.]|nr:Na+/H+ antiporter subunit G [Luteimonas sp.]